MNQFDKIVEGSLSIAQAKALESQNSELCPIHLLWGLILNPSSFSSGVIGHLKDEIEKNINLLPHYVQKEENLEKMRPSGAFQSWLNLANSNAIQEKRNEISEKDLIKTMPRFFPGLSIDYSLFGDLEKNEKIEVPAFLVNLNERAASGKLDPVIGRTKEIRALMEVLGRRSKNNPVLVGPAGVGKTAIVEGLAEAIEKDQVPDILKGKTIYSMELGALLAGTKFRGDFEERIQHLLKFAESNAGQVIIFIDEIHQLIGAGKTDGAMDAANLLKPALSRGSLHCIGATTEDEFQKYILNDAALERRFRQIVVKEPTKEDSIEILMGIRDKFEGHHGIKITDEAIFSAVHLSDQYLTDKNLPDKAIDLIDESASALKLSAETMPADLEMLQAEIRNKSILLKTEFDKDLEKEISTLQENFQKGLLEWEKKVDDLKKVSLIKNELEKDKFDLEKAERNQNYEEASKIKYSLIPQKEKKLKDLNHKWELNAQSIASVVSRQTGIPINKILKEKQESLLQLEGFLKEHIYGQDEALHEISESLLSSYAGLTDETRPLGSFLLTGPTGVGKTETAKQLAKYLFDDESNLIRIDLSEFSEKHSVAKLIGSPAGYVGYEDGGILTEAVRRRPYSVILFDEIEKAHYGFSDILLQVLDDGRLTDNKGRVINFKNTVILLTTNSKDIESDFRPEVLGRLDSVLNYKFLDKSIMNKLVLKQIHLLKERIKNKNLSIDFSQSAIDHLSNLGHDPTYGARPLQNLFNKLVVRPLSKKIIGGLHNSSKKENLFFDMEGDVLKINNMP